MFSEIVENVCRISGTREQHNWPTCSTPIEDLEPDTFYHGYELHHMFRGIVPRAGLLRVQGTDGHGRGQKTQVE
jgi:hypothetical protein